ncbi:ABC-2 transporter permease [Dyella agri]|uniref:ABC-2 transporter permease n=1 Tax=Dyella agri TaxID=1926869 RepID=A0ABW8KGY3_9GAMM
MNEMYWLVKREFWEHRGGFLWAPLITGGVFLLLNLMGIVASEVIGSQHGFHFMFNNTHFFDHAMDADEVAKAGALMDMVMYSTTLIISFVLGFVVFFYCLGALYDDRRDRSLLFWKSLPLSDSATVLSKVVAATLLAPLIAVICGVITGIAMLLLFTITLSFHGAGVWHLLVYAHPFQVIANLIGSIPLYALWALPSVGWLLLCSAWARSKPFLWAAVLPVAVGLMLGWFNLMGGRLASDGWYWREVFGRLVMSVFPGSWLGQQQFANAGSGAEHSLDFLSLSSSYSVMASPSIWIGAIVGIALLAGAIWLRRWRDDT